MLEWGNTPSQDEIDKFHRKLHENNILKATLQKKDDYHYECHGAIIRKNGYITGENLTKLNNALSKSENEETTNFIKGILKCVSHSEEHEEIEPQIDKFETNCESAPECETHFQRPKKFCRMPKNPYLQPIQVETTNPFNYLNIEEMEIPEDT